MLSSPAHLYQAPLLTKLAAFSEAMAAEMRTLNLENVLPIHPLPERLGLNEISWGASGKPASDITLFAQVSLIRKQPNLIIVESRVVALRDCKPWLTDSSDEPRYDMERVGDGFRTCVATPDRLDAFVGRAMKAPFVSACAKWIARRNHLTALPEIKSGPRL